MLSVRPPAGAFVYPAGEDRPIVLIAGGVGITPLMGMLRHSLDAEPTRPITLFYSVRTVEDIAFRDELRLLDRRHDNFRAFIAISDGPASREFFPGRINEAFVVTMAPDVTHAICLMCGPQPMLDAMTALLTSVGVPRQQISFEIFQAAVAAAGPAATAPAAATTAVSADASGAGHEVRFQQSGVTASATGTETLLEAAESCGAGIPSLCRAGVCGTCRTKVLKGKVECRSQVLDDQDRNDGFVLACVSEVMSDCAVDA
jgi:ferredoxin-NADP reductase